jgi:hypothetical protein
MKDFELLLYDQHDPRLAKSFFYFWIRNNIPHTSRVIKVCCDESWNSEILEFSKNIGENIIITNHGDIWEGTYPNVIVYSKQYKFHIQFIKQNNVLQVIIFAENDVYENIINTLLEKFNIEQKGLKAQWLVMSGSGLTTKSVDIDINNEIHSEMYPFLQERNTTLDEYYDAFKNSSPKILLLMGERGTGKTSFIRGLLKRHCWDAMISYDERVLTHDSTLIKFLESSSDCFVIEDSDNLIYKREQGNNFVHKFLNLGDGLITKSGKKLILSTNITSTDEIDSALIRPGRCFDVLQFNKLTPEQSRNLIETRNLDITPPDRDVSIAELFNQQPKFSSDKLKKRVGFL